MAELSLTCSTTRLTSSRRHSSSTYSTSVFSWSRKRESEILTQKINTRMVELEKDGDEVINNLRKLSSWVKEMLENVSINVNTLKTKEDPKNTYQEVSQVLLEAEDNISMLAASIARWKSSEIDSGENDVTNNIGESGKYLVTEPVPNRHEVVEEEVVKESVGSMSGKMDQSLTKLKNETASVKIMKNQLKNCESLTPKTGDVNEFYAALKYPDVKTIGQEIKIKYEKMLNTCTDPRKLKSNQICEVGDQNNNLPVKEKPMDSVVMVTNLDPKFMDCDRLFNLISPYAVVKRIKFVKKAHEFQTALIELGNKAMAKRVMDFLKDTEITGKMLKIEPLYKLNATELKADLQVSLPNGSKAFKDFRQKKEKQYFYHDPISMYPPSRTLHFYRSPKLTEEEFCQVFEGLKAPVPYKVMWFPNKTGVGCLQFKSKEEALKAICIVNQAKAFGGRIHLAFSYERKDHQFYKKK